MMSGVCATVSGLVITVGLKRQIMSASAFYFFSSACQIVYSYFIKLVAMFAILKYQLHNML